MASLGGVLSTASVALSADLIHKVVQITHVEDGNVATGTTQIPNDDTIPQKTEGDEYMSLAHTPLDSSNILYILVFALVENDTQSRMSIALFKDAESDAISTHYQQGDASEGKWCSLLHKIVAGGTSAITFKVRAGSAGSGTNTFNGDAGTRLYGGTMASNITIFEVEP